MDWRQAAEHVGAWTDANVDPVNRAQFREIGESELAGLHEGNFARYQIRPSEFAAWRTRWNG